MAEETTTLAAGSSEAMARCEERLGYVFRDKSLLREALTHASGAAHRLASYERLEFLGDAVLGFVVCELLFQRCEKLQEGDMTKIKSVVVSRQSCAAIGKLLGLEDFLILGKGMTTSRRLPTSLLAGAFESIVAAIYVDGGLDVAREFILRHVRPLVEATIDGAQEANYKSQLQQFCQREYGSTPTYTVLDEKGPDHCKCFKVSARLGERAFSPAWGSNKKEAEQRAALNALNEIAGQPAAFPGD